MIRRRVAFVIAPALAALTVAGTAPSAAAQPTIVQLSPQPAPPVELAQTSTVIVAPSAPPAPQVETIPPPPTSQLSYWRPGHWTWTGADWAWDSGAYVTRPQPTAVWVPGQWAPQPTGGYVWVDGHWQG